MKNHRAVCKAQDAGYVNYKGPPGQYVQSSTITNTSLILSHIVIGVNYVGPSDIFINQKWSLSIVGSQFVSFSVCN